jgi:hypothetical protein
MDGGWEAGAGREGTCVFETFAPCVHLCAFNSVGAVVLLIVSLPVPLSVPLPRGDRLQIRKWPSRSGGTGSHSVAEAFAARRSGLEIEIEIALMMASMLEVEGEGGRHCTGGGGGGRCACGV